MKTRHILFVLALIGLTICFASCGSKQPSALLQEPETNIIDSLQQIVAEEIDAQMAILQAESACTVLINKDGQLVADLGLTQRSRRIFIYNYLKPSVDQGYVTMSVPEIPSKPDQTYKLTGKGLRLYKELMGE